MATQCRAGGQPSVRRAPPPPVSPPHAPSSSQAHLTTPMPETTLTQTCPTITPHGHPSSGPGNRKPTTVDALPSVHCSSLWMQRMATPCDHPPPHLHSHSRPTPNPQSHLSSQQHRLSPHGVLLSCNKHRSTLPPSTTARHASLARHTSLAKPAIPLQELALLLVHRIGVYLSHLSLICRWGHGKRNRHPDPTGQLSNNHIPRSLPLPHLQTSQHMDPTKPTV